MNKDSETHKITNQNDMMTAYQVVKAHLSTNISRENMQNSLAKNVTVCDNRGGNKNGPDPVRTRQEQGLATSLEQAETDKEGLPAMVPENGDWVETRDVAITFLEFAARDYQYAEHALDNAQQMRVFYAEIGKRHGLTNKLIGEIYGITESSVRAMLKKAGE